MNEKEEIEIDLARVCLLYTSFCLVSLIISLWI